MSPTVSAQFMTILEKKRIGDLRPFLQALDAAQKKELAAALKKIGKEYLLYQQVRTGVSSFTFRQKANDVQKEMIWIAAFFVYNLTDFLKIESAERILQREILEKVLDWYCPSWFSELVNRQASAAFMLYEVNYELIMDLTEKGYLHPSKELIVRALPPALFYRNHPNVYYRPDNLLRRPITLDEHIWWLFEFASNINWIDAEPQAKSDFPPEQQSWTATFKRFSAEGKIDRQRLLRASLQASNRNFDKLASGWFVDLFIALEPQNHELIGVQQELIGVLASPHSKPIGNALRCLRDIADEKEFLHGDFLHQTPVLLASETKNVITSTLAVMEKLAKKNTDTRAEICRLAAQVFIHTDEQLQTRAAKLIDKYRGSIDGDFSGTLQPYETNLLSAPRALLGDLLQPGTAKPPEEALLSPTEEAHAEIPPVTTVDDIVFLASQAFDNNQPWHIELLPAVLVNSLHLLTGPQIAMLEPALQRALKIEKSGIQAAQGMLDRVLARFFIDVCMVLIRKDPIAAQGMQTLITQFGWDVVGEHQSFMIKRTNFEKQSLMQMHGQLLSIALEKMKSNNRLPMMSTPTHEPGFIDPAVLIDRLASYQRAGKIPWELDLQIAVSRLIRPTTGAQQQTLITRARTSLTGELQHLVLFMLDEENDPPGGSAYEGVWITAALAKPGKKVPQILIKGEYHQQLIDRYQGNYKWEMIEHQVTRKEYDWQQKKNVEIKVMERKLVIDLHETAIPPEKKEAGLLKKAFGRLFSTVKEKTESISWPGTFYDDLRIKGYYELNEYNNIRRVLLLSPHNPEPLLAHVIYHCLKVSDFFAAENKRLVIATLQTLYDIWDGQGQMSYLFLGTCFLAGDKTVNGIATELWLKEVTKGRMDNERLGRIIATQENIEFAPLKRLTDVITKQLFQVSSLHNRQLEQFISHVLANLSGRPIKNLKKLKEIHTELGKLNAST